MRHPLHRLVATVLVVGASWSATAAAQQPAASTHERIVNVGGHTMRVHVQGLAMRRPGSPVVVFEAGATNSLDVWNRVLPGVATFAPVVAYDRAGLGRSEWDSVTPTPRHVATRLRQLLELVGAEPPYVLVGFSWGASLSRWFAGYHPGDVAGIVYVDPGPIVTQSHAEKLASFDSIGVGRAGFDAFWSGFATFMDRLPPAARAEFDVFRGLMEQDPSQRDLRPVPPVPVAVLVAAKYQPLPASLELPYVPRAHFDVDVRQRIRSLEAWALASTHGTFVVANDLTHMIPNEDPDLIVWAVKRVLAAVQEGR